MIKYLSKDHIYKLFGVSIQNQSMSNFTYALRFPYSPRNEDRETDWKDWKTNLIFPVFPVVGPRAKEDFTGGDPGYFKEGFIQVQKAIDFSLISEFNIDINKISLELKRFSSPPYVEDGFITVIVGMFPYIILLSFTFIVILTTKEIVEEKETGIKEAMRLMGMKSWIYWLSWYIKTLVILIPAIIIMVISYKIKLPIKNGLASASIINKTDPFLLALFLFMYSSSLVSFILMCSAFFKKVIKIDIIVIVII